MALFHITNLTKSYAGHAVLKRLNLSVEAGEIVAIMGKSGAGKTTLLSCILGFESADKGVIELDGVTIDHMPIEERQLAYVPQDYGLFPHFSVHDNIAFGMVARAMATDVIDERVHALLRIVELSQAILDRDVATLSGGERQRVALARALAISPQLFLLDEPLSAVDMETRVAVGADLRDIIKKLGIPAIVITHDHTDATTLADTIYRLVDGELQRIAQ